MQRDDSTALSDKEIELVRRIAKRDGISEEQAATRLAQTALARRVRKRSGRVPAKVYGLPRRR